MNIAEKEEVLALQELEDKEPGAGNKAIWTITVTILGFWSTASSRC